jgi:excisionase family DNA binding protein
VAILETGFTASVNAWGKRLASTAQVRNNSKFRDAFRLLHALIQYMRTNDDGQPLLLTIPEAAHRLGVGRTTVYELTSAGELEVVHIGRCARIPTAALDAFVERIRDQSVTKR